MKIVAGKEKMNTRSRAVLEDVQYMRHGAKPVKRKAKKAIDIFNEESLGINALFGDKPAN